MRDHLQTWFEFQLGNYRNYSPTFRGQWSQISLYTHFLKLAWFPGLFNIGGLGSGLVLARLFGSTLEYQKSKIAEEAMGQPHVCAKAENERTIVDCPLPTCITGGVGTLTMYIYIYIHCHYLTKKHKTKVLQ